MDLPHSNKLIVLINLAHIIHLDNRIIEKLHIISFDLPYPPKYGGIIDIYFKLFNLNNIRKNNSKIQIHCFYKDYKPQKPLNDVSSEVHYYPRNVKLKSLKWGVPFIIQSRNNKSLLNNLCKDQAPILFEGLHTTAFLNHPLLRDRHKIVRTHNIEWEYYKHLESASSQIFEKVYFNRESRLLKKYESILKHAQEIWTISPADTVYYKELLPNQQAHIKYLPAFHPNNQVITKTGKGDFALYHGNLSVPENAKAAEMLLNDVIPKTNIKWVIAGMNPGKSLRDLCSKVASKHPLELIINPENDSLEDLLVNAHINVLPTFQATGIKLKLLNALHKGRFCLVNPPMVEQTGLESICEISLNPADFIEKITTLQQIPFSATMIENRKAVLDQHFNNQNNAKKIIEWLSFRS